MLPIYHVHGYIPRNGNGLDTKITLGEDLYHQQYTNIYSWENLIQLSKYKDYHCLFIGMSFTDPNQRRLLDIANTQRGNQSFRHFILRKRSSIKKVKGRLKTFLDNNEKVFDKKLGYGIEFDDLLSEMVNIDCMFDEQDAESLGVRTIWVDGFEDMPEVLNQMRRVD